MMRLWDAAGSQRSNPIDLLASDSAPRHGSAAMRDERPWYKLSLAGTQKYPWFSKPARDPLLCWPDEYDPSTDTPAWENMITNWSGVPGYHRGPLVDTGFQQATLNYAFNNLIDFIPSYSNGVHVEYGYDREDAFVMKQRNFYGALQYIQHYPTKSRMPVDLGFGSDVFYRSVRVPCRTPCACPAHPPVRRRWSLPSTAVHAALATLTST